MQKSLPTILIILGATGDLTQKKIGPSIYHLFKRGELPDSFQLVGYSRRDLSHEAFRDIFREFLVRHSDIDEKDKKVEDFLSHLYYQKGNFENMDDYGNLGKLLGKTDDEWKTCANKLFYLAVPPKYYNDIFDNLSKSGLLDKCDDEQGWTRVIVEKPFGNDLETSKELDQKLGKLFKEEQIYRIDHYLGKETLQNILAFRFMNGLFERQWGRQMIESVEISLNEEMGVEDRGSFYDNVGALRDVGQNHVLQMLAFIAMDKPIPFTPDEIREKRYQVLESLKIFDEKEVEKYTYRGQYKDYKKIEGVEKKSKTETYFHLKAFIQNDRWFGVPFYLEGGKMLGENKKEIIVTFKAPVPSMCPVGLEGHCRNQIIFRLEPKPEISISFIAKKPGLEMEFEPRNFQFSLLEQGELKTEAYSKLLLDCISGDQTLFVSTKEIEMMWKFIDSIQDFWEKGKVDLEKYDSGSSNISLNSKKYLEQTENLK